jgi:hypothetical protein
MFTVGDTVHGFIFLFVSHRAMVGVFQIAQHEAGCVGARIMRAACMVLHMHVCMTQTTACCLDRLYWYVADWISKGFPVLGPSMARDSRLEKRSCKTTASSGLW